MVSEFSLTCTEVSSSARPRLLAFLRLHFPFLSRLGFPRPSSALFPSSSISLLKTLFVLPFLPVAPGSQNGNYHAGTSDGIVGLFSSPTYIAQTIQILTFLTEQFAEVTNVVGIQLLNEPKNVGVITNFCEPARVSLSLFVPFLLTTSPGVSCAKTVKRSPLFEPPR